MANEEFKAWNDSVALLIRSDTRVTMRLGKHPKWKMYGRVFKSMFAEDGLTPQQAKNVYMLNYLR